MGDDFFSDILMPPVPVKGEQIMSFKDAVSKGIANIVNFDGRARRSEYWYMYLLAFIVGLVLELILPSKGSLTKTILTYVPTILTLAVGVRRLHDTGKSGWWMLISLIPLVGPLILIFFFIQDSQSGPNKYGPNPKGDNNYYY